jgi:hypothetical protein
MERGDFSMSANRKRKIRVEMRLTEDEHDVFLRRMRDLGMLNKDSYLRRMALTGYIIRLDMSEVRETLRLIANATSNINQIAKRANETRSIYASDMIQIREEIGNLRLQVSNALKVFRKVQKLMDI